MAQKPLSTAAAERMNLVAQDEIWRYRLKAESEARQNWPQNWGFLTTPFEELIKGEEELPTPKPKIELPERFHIWPVTPVEKYIKNTQAMLTQERRRSHLCHGQHGAFSGDMRVELQSRFLLQRKLNPEQNNKW
ncbi:ciliary microtubule inner protein 1 isoform X3 [Callithrix jacchus]|uniref:uncharacterized protein C20orf85 homolog isoform X3 n=1 Tax=Callithrix jacchus TaxID=9483 RepID=UPI0004F003D6|nr:uncharacterized protein C20orf85 homolog isoform X3 [Callithrix jacchus]